MELKARRKTPSVKIGAVILGSDHLVAIQSMTDTPTADVGKTFDQTVELINAGSDMVRWTVNDDQAALAVPEIIQMLRTEGYKTPIIGDFHFNGHKLLENHPKCAQLLSKYRINPGNVGKWNQHDENFTNIIKIAIKHGKAVRIGVNYGSLDQRLFAEMMDYNAKQAVTKSMEEITYDAMIKSALSSAEKAEELGLTKDKIVLSVKMSDVQDMVTVYSRLAEKCDYALHLGLTEAGGEVQGISSSSVALGILLQQGIGDTIRVSLTPQPKVPRSKEVEVCKQILQSMGLRYFQPVVTSCPGCGRTSSDFFQILAQEVSEYVKERMPVWKSRYHGVEKLRIAVMGCIVNGPGESKHADIGISLPGALEKAIAPVYIDGKKYTTLSGADIKESFIRILEEYIARRYSDA